MRTNNAADVRNEGSGVNLRDQLVSLKRSKHVLTAAQAMCLAQRSTLSSPSGGVGKFVPPAELQKRCAGAATEPSGVPVALYTDLR